MRFVKVDKIIPIVSDPMLMPVRYSLCGILLLVSKKLGLMIYPRASCDKPIINLGPLLFINFFVSRLNAGQVSPGWVANEASPMVK